MFLSCSSVRCSLVSLFLFSTLISGVAFGESPGISLDGQSGCSPLLGVVLLARLCHLPSQCAKRQSLCCASDPSACVVVWHPFPLSALLFPSRSLSAMRPSRAGGHGGTGKTGGGGRGGQHVGSGSEGRGGRALQWLAGADAGGKGNWALWLDGSQFRHALRRLAVFWPARPRRGRMLE